MLYHVTRNGQSYGPYTLEDLQRYVASGNVLPTDLAKSEEMAEWTTVGQVLGMGSPPPPAAGAPAYGGGYAGGATSVYPPGAMLYPDPPNLHWALVLLIGLFTCGLFFIVWDFVQAAWMRKVNPRSNALFFYIAETVINFGGSIFGMSLAFSSALHQVHQTYMNLPYMGLRLGIGLITLTLLEFARFDMQRSMEEHYNGPEPIGLSLNGAMTFFFGSLYFQYHFTRIHEMKQMARYRGAAI
jgi:hypothetical protein